MHGLSWLGPAGEKRQGGALSRSRVAQLGAECWRKFGFVPQMAAFYLVGLVAGGVLDAGKNPTNRPYLPGAFTVSVYFTVPGGYATPVLVVLFPALSWRMWRELGGQKRLHRSLLGCTLGILFVYCMLTLNTYRNWRGLGAGCDHSPAVPLSAREFSLRYRCGEEPSIDRSMGLLAAANKTFSSQDISNFLSAWRSTHPAWTHMLFRIQIVNSSVHSVPWRGGLPPSKAFRGAPQYEARLKWVLGDLERLTRMVVVPDVDFLLWVGDGFEEHSLPASFAPEHAAHRYGPVFVQEMRAGLRNVLAPPRSMRGCPDFAEIAASDNGVRWEDKIGKAVFRGSPTGGIYDVPGWREKPRAVAALLSKEHPELLDAAFTSLEVQTTDAARGEMEALGLRGERLSLDEQLRYKMILNLDGNSLADRFPVQLAGNSVILKQDSDSVEYWYSDLTPNTHYIPIKRDLSDLIPTLNRSLSEEGAGELRRMASAGSEFVLSRLQPDSCWCYWLTLLVWYSSFIGNVTLVDGSEPWCPGRERGR